MSAFLEAEAGIRQLHARYTDAAWRHDYDSFAECFTEDAVWRISGLDLQGRAAIRTAIESILSRMDRVLITFRTPIIDLGVGVANARTYIDERCKWKDGSTNISMGRYFERFREIDGRWYFTWRLFQLLYRGPADLSGEYYLDLPDWGPPPAIPPLSEQAPNTSQARWGIEAS